MKGPMTFTKQKELISMFNEVINNNCLESKKALIAIKSELRYNKEHDMLRSFKVLKYISDEEIPWLGQDALGA